MAFVRVKFDIRVGCKLFTDIQDVSEAQNRTAKVAQSGRKLKPIHAKA